MVIWDKKINELKNDIKLQAIENSRKQERIKELGDRVKEQQAEIEKLKGEKEHIQLQLDQALRDYDKLLEVVNVRSTNTKRK